MLRVVHVIAEFSGHEAMGRTVTETAQRVPGEHFLITTAAHDGTDVFAGVTELGGAVETFPMGRREALDSALRAWRPDIVHLHGGALAPCSLGAQASPPCEPHDDVCVADAAVAASVALQVD